MTVRVSRRVQRFAASVSLAVVAVAVPVEAAEAFVGPAWMKDLVSSSAVDDPEPEPLPVPENAPEIQDVPVAPLDGDLPAAGEQVVTLGGEGETAELTTDGEVSLAPATDAVEGSKLQTEVLDQATAERAGVTGFVFTVESGTSKPLADLGGVAGLEVDLSIDYSGFEHAYGAGYGDRLMVVALPRCALESPRPEGCRAEGVTLPTTNDAATKTLKVDVVDLGALVASETEVGHPEDPVPGVDTSAPVEVAPDQAVIVSDDVHPTAAEQQAAAAEVESISESEVQASTSAPEVAGVGGGAVVLALTSGASGGTGDLSATPLATSSTWQVAPGSGEFSWSYPVPVPKAAFGTAPSVGIGYSSGSLDGITSTVNAQAGPLGAGWGSLSSGFIERRYTRCSDDGNSSAIGDLCWKTDNAIISLNGRTSKLVPKAGTNNTEWVLKGDPGWKVVRSGTIPNETWTVTAADGTQYKLGETHVRKPSASDPSLYVLSPTNARWTVPVFGDDAGEPCNAQLICDQPWRSNLTRVIEPSGAQSRYFYDVETNAYDTLGAIGGANADTYTRAGYLKRIEYGVREADGPESARVNLNAQYRCAALDTSCPAPQPSNAAQYPDVPADMQCVTSACAYNTPTFFQGKRYESVNAEVRVDGGWRGVDHVVFAHTFLTNGDGDKKLYMIGLQRHGFTSGQWLRMPSVSFTHTQLNNRVSADTNGKWMGHFRLNNIKDDYGHQTKVTYGQPTGCSMGTFDDDCFFQIDPNGSMTKFNKFLVTKVEEVDGTGGSPTMTTNYAYEGTPEWAYYDDEFLTADQRKAAWSDWRGYGKTLITQGSSRTRLWVFRGKNNDVKQAYPANQSVREFTSVSVTLPSAATFPDEPWLAGKVYFEESLDSTGTVALTAGLHEFDDDPTVVPNSFDSLTWAVWSAESKTTGLIRKADGTYVTNRSQTTFSQNMHQPIQVLEEGPLNSTIDDRCTKTSFADNPALGMYTYPASVQRLAGSCSSTSEISYAETFYDGSTTLGSAPTKGLVTRTRSKLDDTTFAVGNLTYDSWGRLWTVTDPLGHTTTTTHEDAPAGEYPSWSKVTNHLGHVVTTDWLPDRGVPLKVTDQNGKVTAYAYDGFGRLEKAWSPTEQGNSTPTVQVIYQLAANRDAVPVVQTHRLTGTNPDRFEDSWVLYDSLLRERRSEVRSPEAGKIVVSGTSYDDRGFVKARALPQAVTGAGGQWLSPSAWDNQVTFTYDEMGRAITETSLRGTTTAAVTTTAYTHDTVTVTPQVGGATRTVVDTLGRTAQVGEQAVRGDDTSWKMTSYQYDLADNLMGITDPAGNITTYTYDKGGRRRTSSSPDAGAWQYGFDLVGNQTSATDATGHSTHTTYDELNRPKELHDTSPGGPLLASWSYDAAGELGLLNSSTASGWTTDVTGYDARNRPLGTTWTVPTAATGMAGTYTATYGYDKADRMTSVTYPSIGGLPAETVTTNYNSVGLPDDMTGIDHYVWSAVYDDRGRPDMLGFGPTKPDGTAWMGRDWTYDSDQRLLKVTTAAGTVQNEHGFVYNQVGTLTERTTKLNNTEDWRECFTYDDRYRLTAARTVDSGANCDASTPDGGDQPYKQAFEYTVDGNIKTRSEGGTTRTYNYPTAGSSQPHAPTSVVSGPSMDTYNWDVSTGRLTSRNVAGRAESFTWDPLGRLGSVTGPDGTDSFTYGADGERVMRTTPAGRTVYIAGHEVTANLNGTNVRATRSYRFGGQLIATRSPTGLDYIISDQQGTVEATYASGGNLETSRSYLPYGKRRSGGEFDTDQGWLGEIEDDHASLSYMNARYYDANIGMFISPDPIIDTAHPKSLNAYAYALNNPITYSDPTGLCAAIDGLCPQRWKDPYAIAIASTHAGTAQSLMYRRIRPKDYHYSPDRAQSLTGGDLVALAIAKLYALNADPGFWQAVAAAGGGAAFIGAAQSIAVGNLMRVNPDPGFWNAVAAAGGGAAFLAAIRRMMARRSAIGRYELEFAEVNHPSKHPNTDTWDSTDSVDRTHQVSPDHMYSPFGLANPFPDPAPSCTYKAGEVCVTGNVPGPHPTRTGPPTTSVRTTNDGSSFCGPAGVMSPVPTDGLSAGYTIVSNAVGFILKSLSLPLTGLSGGAGIVSGGCATDSNQPGFDGTYVSPQGVPGCDKGQC